MKPPEFEYARPESLADAVEILDRSVGDAKVLAGGQSLVPLMNFRLAAPALLVDLNRVAELAFIDPEAGRLRIGAMTRIRALELDPAVRETIPLMAAAASWIGHIQIRNRGTVGGSIAHADPAAELPALCLLLDAELVVVSHRGERSIPASQFFAGFFTTLLAEDEILTEIRIPLLTAGARWGFREFAQRRGDFALAGAATVIDGAVGGQGTSRIVVFGTPDRPVRALGAEAIIDAGMTPTSIAEASRLAADEAAIDDPRPDALYRRELTKTLVQRALQDAMAGSPGHRTEVD
jgi:carbon-monoxide dehydrogenase medium subunit